MHWEVSVAHVQNDDICDRLEVAPIEKSLSTPVEMVCTYPIETSRGTSA